MKTIMRYHNKNGGIQAQNKTETVKHYKDGGQGEFSFPAGVYTHRYKHFWKRGTVPIKANHVQAYPTT